MHRLIMLMLIAISLLAAAEGQKKTDKKDRCDRNESVCVDGVMLPAWSPTVGLTTGDRVARAIVYFAALAYMFLGVSIIADRFMAAIEVITSKEKSVTLKRITGEEYTVLVRVWNETVSNLTLMALGSSAPEILLSIIEIVGNGFDAGALGPSTIVGSAAFNMYIIIGICVVVIPSPDTRRVKHIYVFWCTVVWSIFAYVWLYAILAVISPGVVQVWEAILTFLFFPLTVITAYLCDRKMFGVFGKRFQGRPGSGFRASTKVDSGKAEAQYTDPDAAAFEQHRQQYIEIFKRLRTEHPDAPIETLETMAEQEAVKSGPKSRAFYRIQATRRLVGGGNLTSKKHIEEHLKQHEHSEQDKGLEESNLVRVYFDPGHYTCMENCGSCRLSVVCERVNVSHPCTVQVDYRTEDGTAHQKSDYVAVKDTLVFKPTETRKVIKVEIIDNDIYEDDEDFTVVLSNPKVLPGPDDVHYRGHGHHHSQQPLVKLSTPQIATVLIVDNDHSGQFAFENEATDVDESQMEARLKVLRVRGARGTVAIPYKTIDGSAKAHKDYTPTEGVLQFKDEQTEATIQVRIICDDDYEKTEDFFVEIGEPIWYDAHGGEYPGLAGVPDAESESARKHQQTNADMGPAASDPEKAGPTEPAETSADAQPDGNERVAGDYTPRNDPDEEDGEGGRPELGEITKCKVVIRENKEFKSFVDKMLVSGTTSVMVGTSSWKQQFVEAVTVEGADEEDEDAEPGIFDYVMHALTMPWKLLFALVPPTDYAGGWLCFVVSICVIGLMTALIGDLASHFGCTVGLEDSVTALTIVALGTSLPDTFASKTAAMGDPHADSSIGNVTGSNAVNVFLGIGIAWSIAAIYHWANDSEFSVDPGGLAFSVTLFCVGATLLVVLLQLRRHLSFFGNAELGGTFGPKVVSCIIFLGTWVVYCTLSTLQVYCVIAGF